MGSVIGDVLPLAVGVAISPMPIIAVILMLLAPRAGAASAGFLAGWVAGRRHGDCLDDHRGHRSSLGRPCLMRNMLAPAVRRDRRRIRRRGTGTAPEWNVRLKTWGGREDHDYGRNDQS